MENYYFLNGNLQIDQQKQQRQEAQPCESVHAQAARKLENLLQQKQSLESDGVGGGVGIFGGFTLISGGGINTNTGNKKRRSSDVILKDLV